MKRVFEGRRFEGLRDRGSGRVYQDMEFQRCYLQGCFAVAKRVKRRPTFLNVHMIECEQRGCDLRGAIVDSCLVQNLRTNGLLQVWGSVFRHVTLRGRMGRIMISALVGVSERAQKLQARFEDTNTEYYAGIDWALDIREAEFEECDLRGLPGHLVRRDPETQVLIRRERVLEGAWKSLDLSRTYWPASLEGLLEDGRPNEVLVAPKLAPDFKNLLAGLVLLRHAGVAEPD